MLKPQRVTFDELSQRLRQFEQRHGYSTIEFYRRHEHTIVRRFSSSCVWCPPNFSRERLYLEQWLGQYLRNGEYLQDCSGLEVWRHPPATTLSRRHGGDL